MVASDLTPVDNVAVKYPKTDGQQTLPDQRRIEPSLTEKNVINRLLPNKWEV